MLKKDQANHAKYIPAREGKIHSCQCRLTWRSSKAKGQITLNYSELQSRQFSTKHPVRAELTDQTFLINHAQPEPAELIRRYSRPRSSGVS